MRTCPSGRFGGVLSVIVVLAGMGNLAFSAPSKTHEECRAAAAREARTETGAKAMLSDCAKKFPTQASPQPPEPTEEECIKSGKIYNAAAWVGPKCYADPANRPCTAEDLAQLREAEVTKAVCSKRGDTWNAKQRLCYKKGALFGPPICKRPE